MVTDDGMVDIPATASSSARRVPLRGLATLAQESLDVGRILEQHGTWAVTDYGLECLTVYYPIGKSRLHAEWWPSHMAGKAWVVLPDFLGALEAGRRTYPHGKQGFE